MPKSLAVGDIMRWNGSLWENALGLSHFDVLHYGAVGDGVTDDTEAIQDAIDAASAAGGGIVLLPPGRYALTPSVTSSYSMPLLGSSAQVHIACVLKSRVTLSCDGATFVALPPVGADSAWHYALFGTAALNLTVGTIERIKFLAPRFDFTEASWTTAHTSIYGIIAVGVDRLDILDPEVVSTGSTQQGRLAKILNCERVRVPGIRAENITQVLYCNYVTDLEFSGSVDTFVEAFDIDGPCYHVTADVTCRNGTGEGQCLDIASVQDGHFKLRCQNVGNAAIVYQKGDAYAAFSDWATNLPTSTYTSSPVFSRRVTLDVVGSDIHHASLRAIQVSLERGATTFGANYWDGKSVISDITIRADLTDTDPIVVYECDNLDLDATLRTVTTDGGATTGAAAQLTQSTADATKISESKLTGRARVKVVSSTGMGVLCISPTDFELEADVDGYNSQDDADTPNGVRIRDLSRKAGIVSIRNIRVKNGDTTVAPIDLRITNEGSGSATLVRDLGGHRLSGATPVEFGGTNGGQHMLNRESRDIASLSTTAGTVKVDLFAMGIGSARIACVRLINKDAIVGNATNYTSLAVRRIRAASATSLGTIAYDNVSYSAGSVFNIAVDGSEAGGLLQAGDVVELAATQNAAGSALTNLTIDWSLVEFAP
jgi:hypothetical protein